MTTPLIRALAKAALFATLVLAPAAIAAAITGQSVSISNFTFAPKDIVVPLGTTVTWINGDDVPHVVRAVDGGFHSKPLDSDDRFSFTFTTPGSFAYFCSLHPKMTGKVIVKR